MKLDMLTICGFDISSHKDVDCLDWSSRVSFVFVSLVVIVVVAGVVVVLLLLLVVVLVYQRIVFATPILNSIYIISPSFASQNHILDFCRLSTSSKKTYLFQAANVAIYRRRILFPCCFFCVVLKIMFKFNSP